MLDQSKAEIIRANPIGAGLDTFRDSFRSISEHLGLSPTLKVLDTTNIEGQSNVQVVLLH